MICPFEYTEIIYESYNNDGCEKNKLRIIDEIPQEMKEESG